MWEAVGLRKSFKHIVHKKLQLVSISEHKELLNNRKIIKL